MANYPDVCLVGLHNVASGGAQPIDVEAARVGQVEAIKTMVSANPVEDVDRYRAALGPNIFILARLYIGGLGDRSVSGEQAARDWTPELQRYWDRGVRHFEIHNEPNLRQEGMWRNWQNGAEFANWWLAAARVLRQRFPGIQLGWPGLSPGGDLPNVRYRSDWFLRDARPALEAADWIGAHAYEVFNHTDRGAGGAWRNERDAMRGKWLAVTEFSSPQQQPGTQAVQYRKFYEAMRHEPHVFAAFCYCVYGDSFKHESWRTPDGKSLLPHAAEVARRRFTGQPSTPANPPPGIVWLSEPHPAAYVDDKYAGAIIRTYAGAEFKHVAPGTELARRSQPATIAGLPRRVVVNRDLGLHVLADRLSEHPPIDRWAIAVRALFEAFGRDREVLITMLAVGAAESAQYTLDRGDKAEGALGFYGEYACEGYLSFGPWQVMAGVHHEWYEQLTGSSKPCDWYKASHNWKFAAAMAKIVFDRAGGNPRGFGAWSTFDDGAHLVHMPRARRVVDALLASLPAEPPVLPETAVADGFDSPVGDAASLGPDGLWMAQPERGRWFDANPYSNRYTDSAGKAALHTGADLNWNPPGGWNADKDQPWRAAASGVVRYAGKRSTPWGLVVIIEHDPLADGTKAVTRSAHLATLRVAVGQRVQRGELIGTIGAPGGGTEHAHFDVSLTDALLRDAGDWPQLDLARLRRDYVDPLKFIGEHRPKGA